MPPFLLYPPFFIPLQPLNRNPVIDFSKYIKPFFSFLIKITMLRITILTFLLFISTHSQALFDPINPANYLWINYQLKSPLRSNGAFSTGVLPCQSRIGKCSILYSSLPFGWTSNKDGSFNTPRSDAERSGAFPIEAIMSEPTGQKINANLIVLIQNGFFTVVDKKDFFQQKGYNKQTEATRYQQSYFNKDVPDGFPSIDTLSTALRSDNISIIPSVISEIVERYAPCISKQKYLKNIKTLLTDTIRNNINRINNNERQIKSLTQSLSDLQSQRATKLKQQGTLSQIQDLTSKIQVLGRQVSRYKLQALNFKKLGQSVLDDLADFQINVSKLNSQQTKLIAKNILVNDAYLEKVLNQSIDLRKNLIQAEIQKQLVGVDRNSKSFTTVIRSFALSTVLLRINQINLENKKIQLNNLDYLINLKKSLLSAVDKIYQDYFPSKPEPVKTITAQSSRRAKQLQSQNQLLQRGLGDINALFDKTKCPK